MCIAQHIHVVCHMWTRVLHSRACSVWGGCGQGLAVSVDTQATCCAVCRADVWRMAAH